LLVSAIITALVSSFGPRTRRQLRGVTRVALDRTRMILHSVKISIDFVKALARQRKDRPQGYPPSEPDSRTASECLVAGPENIVVGAESQISIKKEDFPSPQELERHDNSTAAKGLESATDGIAIRPESQNCTRQELERRREIVRQFFNDFWRAA